MQPTTITSHSQRNNGQESGRSSPDSDPGQPAAPVPPHHRHANDDSGDSDRSSVRLLDNGSEDAAQRPMKRRRRSRWDAGPGWTPREAHGSPEHHVHPAAARKSSRSSSEGPVAASAVVPQPPQHASDAHAGVIGDSAATCTLRESLVQTASPARQAAPARAASAPQTCFSPAHGIAPTQPTAGDRASAGAAGAEQRSTEHIGCERGSTAGGPHAEGDSCPVVAARAAELQASHKQPSSPVSGAPADPEAEAARCAALHLGPDTRTWSVCVPPALKHTIRPTHTHSARGVPAETVQLLILAHPICRWRERKIRAAKRAARSELSVSKGDWCVFCSVAQAPGASLVSPSALVSTLL